MFKKVAENPKFGSKGNSSDYFSKMPSKCRLLKLCVYGFMIALFWLCTYIYMSASKLELLKEFQKEDLDLKKVQQKLSDLVARGFNFEAHELPERLINDAPVTTKKFIEVDNGITAEAKQFAKDLGLVNPGENGAAVELPKNLSEDIQKRIKDGYDTQGYNAFISSMVSLNRNIPDVRSDVCKNKVYTNLPKCSILIPFHNEDWMLLMRTVHSVLLRSPYELIEEIILIDDASDRENLRAPLDEYIKNYPKVKVIRSYRRLGIISNRLLGAVNAVGPVFVYIDSHVEVSPGWLEPILDRFSKDMNVVVWPRVSTIDGDSLKMWLDNNDAGNIGGFAWNMDFNWINIKWYEGDHPTEMWEPKKSPTIIGATYAISKQFFTSVGMLDPDFDIWGGEDVELSFKAWLCGGKVEYVPCSFVAHMYKAHKYTWPKSEKGGYRWNTDRIAEVWLDEYKRYYYRSVGDTKDRKYGDISERLEIRKKCKPFKWLIDNVYPNMPIPDDIKDPTPKPIEEKPVEEKPKNGTR